MDERRNEYEKFKFSMGGPDQIAGANAFFQKYWKAFTYHGPEFVESLKTQPIRYRTHPTTPRPDGSPGWPAWQSAQILHDGKWFDLCRTDLTDNVTTYGGISFGDPEGKCSVDFCTLYGARVTEDTIYIIDSWSDG
jgi:hypothetical protein